MLTAIINWGFKIFRAENILNRIKPLIETTLLICSRLALTFLEKKVQRLLIKAGKSRKRKKITCDRNRNNFRQKLPRYFVCTLKCSLVLVKMRCLTGQLKDSMPLTKNKALINDNDNSRFDNVGNLCCGGRWKYHNRTSF